MQRVTTTIALLSCAVLIYSDTAAAQTDEQIALAVLPLPESDRAGAMVLGYDGDALVTLRKGTGPFICLADRPGDERFQAACYHRSLEPYMARGRELRAQGMDSRASLEKRWEEIDAGTLEMPRHPAALHQLFGNPDTVTPNSLEGLTRLTVIYVAYATEEQMGLPTTPGGGVPWLMFSGKPTAHVMISN